MLAEPVNGERERETTSGEATPGDWDTRPPIADDFDYRSLREN